MLVDLFGLGSQLPFRLLLALAVAAVGVVTYALVSRRTGRVAGLVAAALLVFLGPAWEDLLWSFQIGFVGSLATGLGALLALERDSPRRNAAACVLLILSIALSDVGIPFGVAAAIAVALRRRPGQAWIPLVPLLLFGIWFATYGRAAPSAFSSANVLGLPTYVLNSAASGVASVTGFSREGWFGNTTAWARPLLGIALAGTLVWFLRGGRPSSSVVVAVHRMRLLPARRPESQRGCRRLPVPADIPAPVGGSVVTNRGDDPLGVGVRRFAGPERPRVLGVLPPGATARIAIPRDSVAIPWHVTGRSRSGRLQVCPA